MVALVKMSQVLQLPSDVCMRACDTVVQRPIPPLALYRCVTPKQDRVRTLYTPWT